jgi:membrane fusion protein (multidrug efflux system)
VVRPPILLLALLAMPCALACGESPAAVPEGPPPAVVQVVTAETRTLPRTLSAVGGLESSKTAAVAAEIAGTVVALDLPEGKPVEAGRVLARLDDSAARAALSVAEARRQNARDRLARQEPLHAQGVASDQALDDARAEVRASEGAFQEARTLLDKHTIRAPYAGLIGLKQVNVGQYVAAGQPIVELTLAQGLELRFSLPQQDLPHVAVGQVVHGVVGRCEARFEGRVSAVDPRVDASTRMFNVQALVGGGEDGALHPGMAVRVRLLVEEEPDAILLPQEAIVRQGTKYVVYTVDAEGHAQPREVALGEFFVDGVHVTSGVAAGERVVASGQQKLQPGSLIDPKPFEPTHNPNVQTGRYGPADCAPS